MSARRGASPARRPRSDWGFILGNTLGLMAATFVAATALWPIYRSTEFVVLVVVAFLLGVLVAVPGAVFHWPAWLVGLVTIALFLLAGVPLAIPGEALNRVLPSAQGMLDLLRATALGWKQLVTIVLPVGSYQALLVPALILVLLSTVAGLSIALRTRIGELAALAPAALFIAGIGLGPTRAATPIESGLGLFVVLLFWLLWLRSVRRHAIVRLVAQQSRRTIESAADRRLGAARGLVSAALIIAVAIAAGTVAAIALPVSVPRDVLRARVQQPFDPRSYPSPLSAFRGYLQPGAADEALLEVSGLPAGGRIRIAALDSYDGIVYSVGSAAVSSASGSFTRLPDRLDQSVIGGEQTSLAVTVDGYNGVWVPGAGALERIIFSGPTAGARSDSFFYNDNSGTGAVLTGLTRGDRYTSVAVMPREPATLAVLQPGTAILPPLDVVPDDLDQVLARYVGPGDPPGVQLQAMLDGLKADGYVSHGVGADEPVSRSGHGADRISQLFTDLPMLGDAEQYSVAAALLARRLGFPARVVVGFVPPATGGSGSVTVTGSDISAWIEVQSAEGRWVTIDPNPTVRDIPAKQPDKPAVVSRPQSVVPPAVPDTAEQRDPAPPERTIEDPPAPLDPLLALLLAAATAAGWVLLGLTVLAAPFLLIIAAKARRRRLRRTLTAPLDRIRGGWREFADAALDFGIDLPAAATRIEVAGAVGGPGPMAFASVVDEAVFAPARPGTVEADTIWASVAELRAGLSDGKKRRTRLAALVSLRSLGRYAGGASVLRSVRGKGGSAT
ncbi:transglutaminase-like domain-containing protein [Cryobacterium algoritolerans]|nr:transglutaminase-like domain-containing protein [Cryobacterium algoritolerans]